ncbi:MAG: YbjN domain-containing protein [Thermanaerothrix sp.]|nr:YbjN domain-containing protein [Thermanaerothrix sp.]
MRNLRYPMVLLALLVSAASILIPCTARAGSGPQDLVYKITREELVKIMKQDGYSADLDKDGDIIWKLEGYNALVLTPNDSSIEFYIAFAESKATMEKINAWNMNRRYSRSYMDEKKQACLELDLDLEGGVTRDRIRDFLKTCRESFVTWYKEVLM